MKKLLIIFSILFILLVATISFSLGQNLKNSTLEETVEEKKDFSIYTSAVCEDNKDSIYCQDELFVKCGDIDYKLPRNDVTGSAVFDKDWQDPRTAEAN